LGCRVAELLDMVGLDPAVYGAVPPSCPAVSAKRVATARVIALKATLVICDEAVSSLDVRIQAQTLNLFEQLHRSWGCRTCSLRTTWLWSSR
jgi:peptide/nickel transport system ATP-binding protein